MTNRFLISVAAAALLAGTGFANAQGAGGGMKEGGAPAAQHSAPAPSAGGGAAAPQRDDSGMKSGQSDRMGGKEAQDTKGSKAQPSTASDTDRTGKGGKDMKAEGREGREKSTVGQAPDKSGGAMKGHDDKAGSSMTRDDKMGQKGEKGEMGQKGSTDTNRAQTDRPGSQTTTGNAATSATAAPPAEKQTQIKTAFRSETTIKETTNVNFNISVGAVVPASVHFYPVPARIVEIYPEWRGYEVVLVHGRYVIVRPQTREIVYIIEG
jgi:uncharacterized protein DUF1236